MDPIRSTALVIGLLALLKGLWGLISPRKAVEWARAHILRQDNHHLRFYGFGTAVIGGFLMYVVWNEVAWLATITVIIVTVMTLKGLMTLFFPEMARATLRARAALPRPAIRILCLAMAVLAAYLVAFGLGYF